MEFGKRLSTSQMPRRSEPKQNVIEGTVTKRQERDLPSPARAKSGSSSAALVLHRPKLATRVAAVEKESRKEQVQIFERCPLCKKRPATTEVKVKSITTKLCAECSKPIWHVMGVLDWLIR